jgi:hypothetical protein
VTDSRRELWELPTWRAMLPPGGVREVVVVVLGLLLAWIAAGWMFPAAIVGMVLGTEEFNAAFGLIYWLSVGGGWLVCEVLLLGLAYRSSVVKPRRRLRARRLEELTRSRWDG